MSTDTDDEARRRFLATLTDTLDAGWSRAYEVIEPFRVLGIRLRCEGVDGSVQVVPSVVSHGGVSWAPFPGTGATLRHQTRCGRLTADLCGCGRAPHPGDLGAQQS